MSLSLSLEQSKLAVEEAKRQGIKSIDQVRQFWRNKIFKECSLGGRMVMNAIRKAHKLSTCCTILT